ncbi:hypothetical protein [Nocardia abscessus]|uniref:hypothetical protein n=1 Tax=Nocardia abscessus TaxID=120957 RepID=UPI00245690F2|nr:hypothetical protein [Nocardia abscessus]
MNFAWFPVVRNAELISPSRYAPGLGRLAAWGVGVAVTSLCAVMAGVLMTGFGRAWLSSRTCPDLTPRKLLIVIRRTRTVLVPSFAHSAKVTFSPRKT